MQIWIIQLIAFAILLSSTVGHSAICDHIFAPVEVQFGNDSLYRDVSKKRWELAEYGPIFRQARARISHTDQALVEFYSSALDLGPSRNWIQSLQRMGQMPMAFTSSPQVTWRDIDDFIEQNHLQLANHPARNAYLKSNRDDYMKSLRPGFALAMKEYERRQWFTQEFRKGAEETFINTLENATYILVRDPKNPHIVWGVLRLVRVHNGKLTLTDKQTGRKLEILGNAEIGWGVDGTHRLGPWSFLTAFDVERLANEFMKSAELHRRVTSGVEPIHLLKLPMELALNIEVPRNYEKVDLTQQEDFKNGAQMVINGRTFELEYEHAVVVEPGLFAIDKQKDKVMIFAELMNWLGHYLANPLLPEWIDEKKIGYWTYNDLPLYKPFGFSVNSNFSPINKYGVVWDIYSASPQAMTEAIINLGDIRTKNSERWLKMREYLNQYLN